MIDLDFQARAGTFALDVTLQAPAGVTALFGPSGAGKTSVLRAIAGLVTPEAGHIRIGDRSLWEGGRGLPVSRRKLGYVFQDARLFPHLSVRQNLRYGGRKEEEAVIALLGLADLLDRRPAGLSGGEAQRVAIGRALMSAPNLLLLDEPLAALDAPRKAEVMPYLARLRGQGVPMLYVSHAMSEVAQLADTLAVIEAGRVRASGPLEQMLADPSMMPLVGVREAGAVLQVRVEGYDPADDLSDVSFDGGRLVLPGRLGARGDSLRLRVPAQEVILARSRPEGLSALNVLEAEVTALSPGRGPGVAVGLRIGRTPILARITRRSADALALQPGQRIYAILKATAVAAQDVGTSRTGG